MRPLPNPKTYIYFDNVQCRCFETPQPTLQFFLNKNQISSNLKEKNKIPISENIKHALSKTNIKRSLKRVANPPTNEIIHQRAVEIHEKSDFRRPTRRNVQELPLLSYHKSPMSAYEINKQNINVTTINFNRPLYEYNRSIKLESPTFERQTYQQVINQQKKVSMISCATSPFERIEISKNPFNFTPTATAYQQFPGLLEKTANTKSMQNLQPLCTLTTQKKLCQPEKVTIKKLSQQIKIPRLKKKDSMYQYFDMGHKQTAAKNSMLYSGVNTSPDKTEIGDKIQMTETATVLKEYSQLDNKNETHKISQTTILKQNTYKSVLKTKRSLLSETNRQKIVAKKQKPKTLLSKMQDVQQIRSLANSDENDDSDKQSVVLGRLNEYNESKTNTIIRKNTAPTKLDRSLQFIPHQNSLIMDSTLGQWKHEFESYYGY